MSMLGSSLATCLGQDPTTPHNGPLPIRPLQVRPLCPLTDLVLPSLIRDPTPSAGHTLLPRHLQTHIFYRQMSGYMVIPTIMITAGNLARRLLILMPLMTTTGLSLAPRLPIPVPLMTTTGLSLAPRLPILMPLMTPTGLSLVPRLPILTPLMTFTGLNLGPRLALPMPLMPTDLQNTLRPCHLQVVALRQPKHRRHRASSL
jgi:hypothetical protein